MAGPPPWRTPVLLAAAGTAFGTYVLVVTAPDRHHDSTSTLFSGAVGGLFSGPGCWRGCAGPGTRSGC
ncbi:hypothetical protein AB0L99_24040 [Streptomyces sp. NPDC051954]|uniref:hypothetical protein n=1 Tax=Streptomyces sp. NPDC051954 TaxID=3155524 RepID=UPI00341BA8DF